MVTLTVNYVRLLLTVSHFDSLQNIEADDAVKKNSEPPRNI